MIYKTRLLSLVLPQKLWLLRHQFQKKYWYLRFISIILVLLITACTATKPPLEFAPDGELITKAIALQLSQTEASISKQLNATSPEFEISQIRVKMLEPVFIEGLSSYYLRGNYSLKLKLPHQEVNQKSNQFEIYLQRQIEGKTWRLLRRQVNSDGASQWSSYLIK